MIYESATKCAKCTGDNILGSDKAACTSTYSSEVDSNCADSFLNSAPQCARCAYGFSFKNNTCTACSLRASGCEICDSSDNNKCLLCQSAHYMNQNGTCAANNPTVPTTPTTPTTPTNVSASIVSWMMIMSLIALLIF